MERDTFKQYIVNTYRYKDSNTESDVLNDAIIIIMLFHYSIRKGNKKHLIMFKIPR